MKCTKCGWDGNRSELVQERTDLEDDDHLYTLIHIMGVERRLFLCPACRRPIQSVRFIYGSEHEHRDLS